MPTETSPPVSLNEIGQIAITVSDLARSQQFYEHTLGMKLLFNAGNMAFFQCGSVRVMLGPPEPGKAVHPSQTILYFRVPDIHATHAALFAAGVAFVQAPQMVARMKDHELWLAFLRDPDGHPIAVMSEMPLQEEPAR
ncbi:MAG TPA: VOC family protein [Acidobacteriaceae bacterium]|nr:VOC family protein [Acidobacteriaceae bacterium]